MSQMAMEGERRRGDTSGGPEPAVRLDHVSKAFGSRRVLDEFNGGGLHESQSPSRRMRSSRLASRSRRGSAMRSASMSARSS